MPVKELKDLIIPISEYPIVDSEATVYEAVKRLDESRRNSDEKKHPFQAVLVADGKGNIIGKVGQFSLLKLLEPKNRVSDDRKSLERAGVSDELMETALDHYRNLNLSLEEMYYGAHRLPVKLAMTPFEEHMDISCSISDIIHKMLEWRAISILITENNKPVGLIRLVDICDEIIRQMQKTDYLPKGED